MRILRKLFLMSVVLLPFAMVIGCGEGDVATGGDTPEEGNSATDDMSDEEVTDFEEGEEGGSIGGGGAAAADPNEQ